MSIEKIKISSDILPILPQSIEDFQGLSIIEMRNYLLSNPVRQVFSVGEIRSLLDLSHSEDSLAKGVVEACFTKLAKTSLPKWQKLIAEK